MPVFVSMLRGVNIGGHNKIKMEELRALYESLGFRNPQSFIQSGNVVFKQNSGIVRVLTKRIAEAIEHKFGFRPAVLLRTTSELREVIAKILLPPEEKSRSQQTCRLRFLVQLSRPRVAKNCWHRMCARRIACCITANSTSIFPRAWLARSYPCQWSNES